MSQLQLYKGLKSEYSEKKDKIADGGLVITKKENNSSVGNLYINDGGTHVQLSSDEAVINVTMSENNELIVSKINGSSNTILTVDETLKSDSSNPVENKAIYTKFELQNADIENNIKTPLNILIGEDSEKSVRDISIEVLTEQLITDTAQASLDTLEEIADWIQKHPEDAAAMNTAIQNNSKDIDDIQLDIMRLDVQPDWNLENDQSHAYIKNKPPIKNGNGNDSVVVGDGDALSNNSISLGVKSLAGSRAYTILGIEKNELMYYLDSVEGLEVGDVYSVHVLYEDGTSSQAENYGTITDISVHENTVTVDNLYCNKDFTTSENYLDENGIDTERNTFRIVSKPNIGNRVVGAHAFSEGYQTQALSKNSHAEGNENVAYGSHSHAEGSRNKAGYCSHAEGRDNQAIGQISHAEGRNNIASGTSSHAEGALNTSSGDQSHAEGGRTKAIGGNSHAEGYNTESSGEQAHAEGWGTKASHYASHAEGWGTKASNYASHAEGDSTTASGNCSHAEGNWTTASSHSSHAEGNGTTASGYSSHAEGNETTASGRQSHAEGYQTTASGHSSHVEGQYNIEDTESKYAHIVGNGNSNESHSNAHTLDWQGNAWYQGSITSNGADYAEYFEWEDGNLNNEDRVGLLVTLDGDKIKLANTGDEVLGIISGTAAVLGDNYECEWNGKYLTDDFGRVIYDLVEEFIDEEHIEFKEVEKEVIDEETNETRTEIELEEIKTVEKKSIGFWKHPRLNPNYDPSKEYVNRADRPEWDAVGMLGKLYVRDDGTCEVNGYATVGENGVATKSDEKTNIRVLSRVNEDVIRVLLK